MVSSRHKSSKPPVGSRCASSHVHRPRFRLNNQVYSHINIQQRATEEEPPPKSGNKKEDFVRHESLQLEIEDQLLYKNKLASSLDSPSRPRTFAEAIMSTRGRSRGGRKDSLKDGDATLGGPMSLESLVPFKYTFRKKKKPNKWAPFDLGGADSASEVGSFSEVDAESSRAVSPNPQILLASVPSSPRPLLPTSTIPTLSSAKDKRQGRFIEEKGFSVIGDSHQTPTQNSFEFKPLSPAAPDSTADTGSFLDSISYNCSLKEVDCNPSDTQSTKERTEAAMASIADAFGIGKLPKVGEDAFDSVEWDPDLPTASARESPEIVPVVPKPIAYTTVGSIVKNAAPSFTAPNRIQREGAGRRPLMPFNQNRPTMSIRHQDLSYSHQRDPPPPLNMQNSMHYTQQLTQSPVRLNQGPQSASSHSSRSTMSVQQVPLFQDEQKSTKRHTAPQMFSGNIGGSPGNCNIPSKIFNGTAPENGFASNAALPKPSSKQDLDLGMQALPSSDFSGENRNRRSAHLSGLEKMQTIQRLAKFDNPMQELARSRLSALSVSNYLGRTIANPNGVSTATSSPVNETMSRKILPGELDRSYRFPPPGFGGSPLSHSNPLLRSYSDSTSQPANMRASGVPQPLKAGPPGQRYYATAGTTKAPMNLNETRRLESEPDPLSLNYDEYACLIPSQSAFYNPALTQQSSTDQLLRLLNIETNEPKLQAPQERTAAFEGEIVGSRLVDTLPPSVTSQYYPNGFPPNMDASSKPLSYKMMVKMGQIPGARDPVTAAEKAVAKEKEMSDWFYGESRKLTKTIDDHINDMEERERNRRVNPFGAIGPPSKKNLPEKRIMSAEEFKNMTTAEAAVPLVNAAFGALLQYADQTSESRARLSGWNQNPTEWLIDSSDKGNTSFFGEDWGPPPNHVSKVRKYQPAVHHATTRPWELV